MNMYHRKKSQRGIATIEFAVCAAFFFFMLVAVVAGGHFFWTHNALVEATRRGARYAANQCPDTAPFASCPDRATTITRVKNVVLYDSSTAGTSPFVPGLTDTMVTITYSSNYGVATGEVSVKIENYQYSIFGVSITMPTYQATVEGESAGFVPANL